MNILFLTTHFNIGGITSYILTLAGELKKRGHGVCVVSSGGDMVETLSTLNIEHITVDIRTKSELSPKIYFALPGLRRLIRERSIEIIHTHTRVTQVMGTFLGKMTRARHVSTCHGFFKPRLSRKIFPCFGEAAIAVSAPVRDHLTADLKVPAQKVYLIPSGLDLSRFTVPSHETKVQVRRRFDLKEAPVVGIIARLSEVKGHETLIRAMKQVNAQIPQAVLMIVGEGKLEEPLKRLSSEIGLKNTVRFYPIVNQTAEVLSVFDIFVMPSLQEGLGLSIMEAQAMGLPVVASRVGGIPSLIEDGKTGVLVAPQDIDGLAKAIINLINDRGKARSMGQAARRFVEENFSAQRMASRTLETYQAVGL